MEQETIMNLDDLCYQTFSEIDKDSNLIIDNTISISEVCEKLKPRIDNYFNQLDNQIYNSQKIQEIKERIMQNLPNYIQSLKKHDEEINKSLIKFFRNLVLLITGTYLITYGISYVFKQPSHVCALEICGILSGLYFCKHLMESLLDDGSYEMHNIRRKCFELK